MRNTNRRLVVSTQYATIKKLGWKLRHIVLSSTVLKRAKLTRLYVGLDKKQAKIEGTFTDKNWILFKFGQATKKTFFSADGNGMLLRLGKTLFRIINYGLSGKHVSYR